MNFKNKITKIIMSGVILLNIGLVNVSVANGEDLKGDYETYTQMLNEYMFNNKDLKQIGLEKGKEIHIMNFKLIELNSIGKKETVIDLEKVVPHLEYLNNKIGVNFDKNINVIVVNKEIKENGLEKLGGSDFNTVVLYNNPYISELSEKDKERVLIKTLLHEIGHFVKDQITNDVWNEYMNRRIEPTSIYADIKKAELENKMYKWESNPNEVFAEDFSAVFVNKEYRIMDNKTNLDVLGKEEGEWYRNLVINSLKKKFSEVIINEGMYCERMEK